MTNKRSPTPMSSTRTPNAPTERDWKRVMADIARGVPREQLIPPDDPAMDRYALRAARVDGADPVGLPGLVTRPAVDGPPPVTVPGPATSRRADDHPLTAEARAMATRAKAELHAMSPDAGADERLLLDLAGDSAGTAMALGMVAQDQLGMIAAALDNPRVLRAIVGCVKDLTIVQNAVTRRVQSLTQAASNLRTQREFLARHGGRREL